MQRNKERALAFLSSATALSYIPYAYQHNYSLLFYQSCPAVFVFFFTPLDTGTAAVISPVGALVYKGEEITINNFKIGDLTQKLYDYLTGIQWGKEEDKYGWTRLVK